MLRVRCKVFIYIIYMDKLEYIFQLQKKFGSKFVDFDSLTPEEKQIKSLEFLGHLGEELVEFRRELPLRKHWSSKRTTPVDQTKLLDEYVDALHFFVSIALINGWTSEDVYDAYIAKNQENINRQNNDY